MITEKRDVVEVPVLAFNYAQTIITLAFVPAFMAFSFAVSESINFALPSPSPSTVTIVGTNSTFEFIISTTTQPRVVGAWTAVAGLVFFGVVISVLAINMHANLSGWSNVYNSDEAYASNQDRILLRTAYLDKLARDREAARRKKDQEEEEEDED